MKTKIYTLSLLLSLAVVTRGDDFRDSLAVLLFSEVNPTVTSAIANNLRDGFSPAYAEFGQQVANDFVGSEEFRELMVDIFEPPCRHRLTMDELVYLNQWYRKSRIAQQKYHINVDALQQDKKLTKCLEASYANLTVFVRTGKKAANIIVAPYPVPASFRQEYGYIINSENEAIEYASKHLLDSLPNIVSQLTAEDCRLPAVRDFAFKMSKQILLAYFYNNYTEQELKYYSDGLESSARHKYTYACKEALQQNNLLGLQLLGGLFKYLMHHNPDAAQLFNDSMDVISRKGVARDSLPEQPIEQQPVAPEKSEPQAIKNSNVKEGQTVWYRLNKPIVPDQESENLIIVPKESGQYKGIVKSVHDDNTVTIRIYSNDGKQRVIATRTMEVIPPDMLEYLGRQTDLYPSGKVKEVRIYNKQHKLVSVTVNDTLGNVIKTIERRGDTRTEKQYHTNGQLRVERVTVGDETHAKYFDKTGRQVSYLEGDLFAYDDGIYVIAGHKPTYPGGEDAMYEFINDNVRPRGVRDKSVVCAVHVKSDGSIGEVRIKESSGIDEVDEEAVRVLKSMPKWNPGTVKKWKFVQNIKEAKVQLIKTMFTITVYFDK